MKSKAFFYFVFLSFWMSIFILFQSCKNLESRIQEGDIIFQSDTCNQSKAVKLATHSEYSHCGIIVYENHNFYVYEAVQPVKKTLLSRFIHRGLGGHYVIKRLKNSEKILTTENTEKLKTILKQFIDKDYDLPFEWTDDKMYCSELVWKAYKRSVGIEIGKLSQLKDFDLTSQKVKDILKERYGDSIPYEQFVIPPSAIFNSEKLFTVDSI